jgi:hypothetical protein
MTFDKEGLASLLERVREATGPDRDIDQAIREAIDGKMMERQLLWRETFPYSASIDASLALVGRLLPGANCVGFDKDPRDVTAYVSRNHVAEGHYFVEGVAATPPLAILAALLSALNKDVR